MANGGWKSIFCSGEEIADILNKDSLIQRTQIIPMPKEGQPDRILLIYWAAAPCMGCGEEKIKKFEFGRKYITERGRLVVLTGRSACPFCEKVRRTLSDLVVTYGYKLIYVDISDPAGKREAVEFGLKDDVNYLLIENFNVVSGGSFVDMMAFQNPTPGTEEENIRAFFNHKLAEVWKDEPSDQNTPK